jgi:hypothetical protein
MRASTKALSSSSSSSSRALPQRNTRRLTPPTCAQLHGPRSHTTAAAALAAAAAAATAGPATQQRRPIAGSTQQQQQPTPAPAPQLVQRYERLRDPAKIGARGSTTVLLDDAGGDVALATYMRLPVEQYYCLDPSQIKQLSGSTFTLSVPRVSLLGTSLEPVIQVQVTSEPNAVVLRATDCQLNASGIMGGLEKIFAMNFVTCLTWSSPPEQQQGQQPAQQLQEQQQQPSAAAPAAATPSSIRAGWDRLKQASGSWGSGGSTSTSSSSSLQQQQAQAPPPRGSITASAVVDVWCEVIPPFNLMPRAVLVGSCNSVLSGLVHSLLPWFTRQLAADYGKWAADAAYRDARAARSRQQ